MGLRNQALEVANAAETWIKPKSIIRIEPVVTIATFLRREDFERSDPLILPLKHLLLRIVVSIARCSKP